MGKVFLNGLIKVCCIAFIVELILGFNGKLLMLGNIPIREILFGLVTIVLGIKMLTAIKDNTYNSRGGNKYE